MSDSFPKYSIVVPALEEELFIGDTLRELRKYLEKHDILEATEIVVVTADSKDRTAEIVRSHATDFSYFRFVEPGMRVGKGRDVQSGMLAASGRYVLFMDADLATPLRHLLPALRHLEEGADMVIGVRPLASIHTGIRKFISLSANMITRLLVAPEFADTQCGFKGFTKDSSELIFNRLMVMGWAFDMEVLAIAVQNNLSIATVSVDDWSEKKPPEKQLSGEASTAAALRTLKEAFNIGKNRLVRSYRIKERVGLLDPDLD